MNLSISTGCPDCFKEQKTINEIFEQQKIKADKLAKEYGQNYAVYIEGQGYNCSPITEGQPLPGGTRYITKMQ
jgi:hypothetical protein